MNMWQQFFSQDFHFAVNLFAALVFMAIGWLHLDAWTGHHAKKEFFKWTGFFALALSFLVQSTMIEQSVLGKAIFGGLTEGLIYGFRTVGYLLVIYGQIIDPLQQVPDNKGLDLEEIVGGRAATPEATGGSADRGQPRKHRAMLLPVIGSVVKWLAPLGGIVLAALYWRRATIGLERHLKRIAFGLLFVALSDIVGLASALRDTTNPVLYSWVAAFGWVWALGQLLLLAGAIIMGIWVWSYLTKRFFSQLFMGCIVTTIVAFFLVTVSLTALLLRSVRTDSLTNLNTAASVLRYAIESKQAEAMAGAQQLATTSDIVQSIKAKDHVRLAQLTENYLADKKLTSLLITGPTGQVLLRGQDIEQWGDSVSSDTLIRRALAGDSRSSIAAYQGVVAPSLQVRSAAVVRDADGTVLGSITTGLELGVGFVDGVKQATGLESSIYAGNILSATTVTAADGKSRNVGSKLADARILKQVLTDGQAYSGALRSQNRELLGVFLPLKDVDNATPGMLLVSEPQSNILRTAGRSIELTFLLTAGLLILSVVPIYYMTKVIEKQLE